MRPRSSMVAVVMVMAVSVVAASCGSSPPRPAVPEWPTTSLETAGAGEAAEPARAPASSGTVEAIGAGEAAEPATTEFIEPAWTMTELGVPDVDAGVAVAAISDNVVVMSTAGGRLTAWVDAGDGWTPAEMGRESVGERVQVDAMGAVPGGVLAAVNYHQSPGPELWFSADGTSWERLEADGLDRPASIHAVAAAGTAVFMTGALRTEESSFVPVVWRSEDLAAWTVTELDARGDVVAAGSSLLVAGPGFGGVLMWRSDDDGRSWVPVPTSQVEGADDYLFYDMAAGDGVLVAVGSADDVEFAIASSADGGGTWVRPELAAGMAEGLEFGYRVQWAGDAFWVITSRRFDAWDDPDRCYIDLASCQAFSEPVVLRSADGIEWAEIDMGAMDPPEYSWINNVVGAGDGVVLVGSARSVLVWHWPSRAAPPLRAPPGVLEEPAFELAWNVAELVVGTTYRHPLYIHCGMGYLATLNGRHWYLVDAPQGTADTGSGRRPRSNWPVAQQTIFGFVTLVDENTIEYTIDDGDVIGVYEPSDQEPPGCM